MTEQKLPPQDRRREDKGMGGRVLAIEQRLGQGASRMAGIETALLENTEATKEVLEIVTMAKSFFKVLGHVGNGIKWLSGIAVAAGVLWQGYTHGGPK